ncbi:MAG: TadE/TadG family type IV pilus assembly protein [Bryobacteraceae bacterium]
MNRSRSLIPAARRRRTQAGQGLVESALSIIVFLALVFGIMEFGRASFVYNQLAYLAQQGTRYASLNGSTAATPATNTSISNYVKSQAIGIPSLTVTTTWQNNQNVPGHWVKVKVDHSFTFLGPFMPAASMNLTSSGQDTILQ